MLLSRHMREVLLVIGVLALALGLRLATYDRYLPYLDYPDEPNYYGFSQEWRGIPTIYMPEGRYAVPPFYEVFGGVVLQLGDWAGLNPWGLPHIHVHLLRIVSVATAILTVLLCIRLGWRLGGPAVGLLCGLIWALSPRIVTMSTLSVPDPYVVFFMALAAVAAIGAVDRQSPLALLVSLLAGIGAIYSKYWIAAAVLPFLMATAYLLWKNPRRILPYLPLYIVIAASSAYYLLAVVNPLGTNPDATEIENFRQSGLANMFDLSRNLSNWHTTIGPLRHVVFWPVLILGSVALLRQPRSPEKRLQVGMLVGLLLTALLTVLLASSFIVSNGPANNLIRHFLPATAMMLAAWGLCLAALTQSLPTRWRSLLFGGLALGLGLSFVPSNFGNIQTFRQSHIVTHVWSYSDSSLPPDGLVLLSGGTPLSTLWNRPWGGYPGDRPMEWFIEPAARIASQNQNDLLERGFSYFILAEPDDYQRFAEADQSAALAGLLDDMLLLKSFDAAAMGAAGPSLDIYRVRPPETVIEAEFADHITLMGYDLSIDAGVLYFRPYWRASRTPSENYSLFVHLRDATREAPIAQADGAPIDPRRLTLQWDDPNEVYIGQPFAIPLPTDTLPDDAFLSVGLYNPQTGMRLRLSDDSLDTLVIPLP